jgi:hypothetical protein
MLRRVRLAVTCAVLALISPVAAPPLHAQAASVAANPAPGPRYENQRAGFTAQDQSTAQLQMNAAAKGPFGSKQNGKIATIVGGAAMIGGLIIGDDAGYAIAVGGLIVGVLGLWTWLG